MNTIKIDFTKITGKIKPMHAINNMPTVPCDSLGLYGKLKEAHVPYGRLHDTGGLFGGARYVDIENIFMDFSADENDPASYDFSFTDVLLSEMIKFGVEPFYRLGCTIENYHYIKSYHIYPPADPNKWARICEHIILHYNYGWADGFHYNIKYWEIWNEPDNEPVIDDNPMWKGTPEQFFELYDITARYLKEKFPELKIGGYASCGFYAISDSNFSETAHSTSRVGYFVEFFHDFFKYISERKTPLDFFSWHSYAGLKENVMYAKYAKEKLTEYGYGEAEVIFNEWNPGIRNRRKAVDASNIAAIMCAMQKTSTDMCMYYDGQASSIYCGIFSLDEMCTLKAYNSFLAFGELYILQNEAESFCDAEGVYICAAVGDKKAVLIVNSNSEMININIETSSDVKNIIECKATDEIHNYEILNFNMNESITLPPYAVWLVYFN